MRLVPAAALFTLLAAMVSSPVARSAADAPVAAGDDFFAYANSGWLEATPLPSGRDRWGARDELEELARGRIAALVESAASAPAGSAARTVADFHAAYLTRPPSRPGASRRSNRCSPASRASRTERS